jgi:hypothetical protein
MPVLTLTVPPKVKSRVTSWLVSRAAQSTHAAQLEWAANVVQYVNYVYSATTVHGGPKHGSVSPTLRKEVPVLGPRFLPLTYLHLHKQNSTPVIKPESTYLKPLNIIHPFYYPNIAKCPQCGSDQVSWQGWTTTGHCNVYGVHHEETALGYQLACEPCWSQVSNNSDDEGYCITTTNTKFWANKEHWEILHKGINCAYHVRGLPISPSTHRWHSSILQAMCSYSGPV